MIGRMEIEKWKRMRSGVSEVLRWREYYVFCFGMEDDFDDWQEMKLAMGFELVTDSLLVWLLILSCVVIPRVRNRVRIMFTMVNCRSQNVVHSQHHGSHL